VLLLLQLNLNPKLHQNLLNKLVPMAKMPMMLKKALEGTRLH